VGAAAPRGTGVMVAPARGGAELIGRERQQAQGSGQRPRVALVRGVFPGSSRVAVEREVLAGIRRYTDKHRSLGIYPLDAHAPVDQHLAHLGVLHGQPEDIVTALNEAGLMPNLEHFVVQVQTESTDLGSAIRRLELVV